MNKNTLKYALAILTLGAVLPIFAQNNKDWEPIGEWPFINRSFRTATVYTGVFKRTKTQVPCNIHVGKQALWFSRNDTLMEAVPGTVLRVEFPNGDTYIPVGSQQMMGKIVREDSIDGSIARIICVRTVNQQELDQQYLDYINKTQNVLQGSGAFSAVADSKTGVKMERKPLPMTTFFFFQVKGDVFLATTKNILSHIDPKRRKEYKAFTRSAEILSYSEKSMNKVWEEFFLKK